MRPRVLPFLALSLSLPFLDHPAMAAGFPPVSSEEAALQAVPGQPNAPAVVLYRHGDFQMLDPARQQQSSTLVVEARVKVLTEAGKKDQGELEIFHSPFYRLKELSGRTVLADGRVLPLDEKSIFERRSSRSRRLSVTAIAFPGVEVGAILDLRYEIKFDSIFFLEPWVFQEDIPVLRSRIVYHMPKEIAARGWSRDPMHVGIQVSDAKSALGTDLTAEVRNAPPLPDEPYGFPTTDLAARFMVVPTKYGVDPLLDTWASTCELIDEANYGPARRNDTAARRRAREIVGQAKAPREQAMAIHRFVRDEIATEPVPGVLVAESDGPDAVLAARRGDYAAKALLLVTLLDASRLKADLVWTASRRDGIFDSTLPSIVWFDRPVVRVVLDGQPVFLDPGDRSLAFGHLDAEHEGTQAVLFRRRKPELITLPTSEFANHQRQATVTLTVGDDGRLSGEGRVRMTGHRAEDQLAAIFGEETPGQVWKAWLEARFNGLVVSDIIAAQAVDDGWAEATFRLTQAEESVLGDEASYSPSQPLGPTAQIFAVPPEQRRTPVMLDYGSRDELQLALSWPANWQLGALPDDRSAEPPVGRFATEWKLDAAAHQLTYHRIFETHAAQFMGRDDYGLLRNLWATAVRNDTQGLALRKGD